MNTWPGWVQGLLLASALAGCGGPAPLPRLVLGTTHTVEDSGLLAALETALRRELGDAYRLTIIVAGSGEVLTMARRRDVDVVLSHSPDDETALVAAGHAESREPVMHNDFVLLGPPSDTIATERATAPEILAGIHEAGALFVSRGDGSGTHRRELALWAAAQMAPDWAGYIEAAAGMADALRVASHRGAYILADRATFEMLRAELRLQPLAAGGDLLRNEYSVLVVAEAANLEGARRLARWIRSPAVQRMIAGYGVEQTGRPLFIPATTTPASREPERD